MYLTDFQGRFVPRFRFQWTNVPAGLLRALAKELFIEDPEDPVQALRAAFGARPKEDFVAAAWATLRERWLRTDKDARDRVVQTLCDLRHEPEWPTGQRDQMTFLRRLRVGHNLRQVVLDEFISMGDAFISLGDGVASTASKADAKTLAAPMSKAIPESASAPNGPTPQGAESTETFITGTESPPTAQASAERPVSKVPPRDRLENGIPAQPVDRTTEVDQGETKQKNRSLLDQLPGIVAAGKRRAAQILEQLEGRNRVTLQTREFVIPSKDTHAADLFHTLRSESEAAPNRLIYGDNLLAMAALLAGDEENPSMRGKLDLIYIDPPFDSKADYRTTVTLPGATIEQKPTVIEQFAYSDTWADGTASYLAMITPRLVLMRELLTQTGSLYLHLDSHVGHYVKIVLDEIFGRENFRNEIVWHYSGWNKQLRTSFEKRHDTIFYYSKGDNPKFNSFFEQWASREEYVRKRKQKVLVDVDGDYVLSDAGGGRRVKRYLDDVMREGVVVDDVWDLDKLNNSASESVNYATQKPEVLLRRLLEAGTDEGDLVADFFVGSGTTAAVAEKLRRRWIAGDLGKPATMITRKRLIDQDAKPFLYQAIGDYQVEHARSILGRKFRAGDLAQVILKLYGALPLPHEDNVGGSLGRVPGGKTLVFADSPSKLTTASTLRRAQQYRDSVLGGFDQVVVLGWNFSAGIGQDISALNDPHLEVLVIPPDLLDRLKKKGGLEKWSGEVRFSSLQYLKAGLASRRSIGGEEELRVNLLNYILLSPDAINLDDKNRAALQQVMNSEPLALIEYWAVDPDYDGDVFRSVWQDYRGNTDNDDDPLRVVTQAVLSLPTREGSRRVCIRAVDVFGFESEVVLDDVELTK